MRPGLLLAHSRPQPLRAESTQRGRKGCALAAVGAEVLEEAADELTVVGRVHSEGVARGKAHARARDVKRDVQHALRARLARQHLCLLQLGPEGFLLGVVACVGHWCNCGVFLMLESAGSSR